MGALDISRTAGQPRRYHFGMCGRYTFFNLDGNELRRVYDLPDIDWDALDLLPRYNAAPTQSLPIIIPATGGGRQLVKAQWGYIPPWSDTRIPRISTINAKAEGLAESRLWGPLLKRPVPGERGRCLVLADGFYEWQKVAGGKQPMRMRRPDNATFTFAGLYGTWYDKAADREVLSFTIVTCAPNALLAPIHNRMAVVLDRAGEQQWLDPDTSLEQCAALCCPCPDDALLAERVSTLVNSPKYDVPECVELVM